MDFRSSSGRCAHSRRLAEAHPQVLIIAHPRATLRPAALLDYARPGDAIVVVGIDRLGRNAAEVMTTIRELRDRGIVLRSLREGIDSSNATGRMIAGVLASLAELELELGRERRAAAREARRARGQLVGRPKHSTNRRLRWRSGCTSAVSQSPPSQARSASAVQQSIGYWPNTKLSDGAAARRCQGVQRRQKLLRRLILAA